MRVYVSSTSQDLEDHRRAVIEILLRSGHMPVCMEHHPAADVYPKEECLREVASCNAYVGIFAWRYGFIPQSCETSITEMEYRAATEGQRHIPALVFLVKENAPWPEDFFDTGSNGQRIKKLRDELQQTKWVSFFTSPDNLAKEVLAAIQKLLHDEKKTESRLEINRVPNPVPRTSIMHFQDRESEILKLHEYLAKKDMRMLLIYGKGGAGKTSLATKLIYELIDKGFSSSSNVVESIVYITLVDPQNRFPERIVELVSRTLEHSAAKKLKEVWSQQHIPLSERLAILFCEFLAQHRCLIVLDNLESVLNNDNRILKEYDALGQFVDDFFRYDHSALLMATSRRALFLSPNIEIAAINKKMQIPLDEGLPEGFAIALLRELDCCAERSLGIRNAQDRLLGNIARRCQCIPRTLETLVAVLFQKSTWTLETLMAKESYLTEIIEHPAKELYNSLSSDQERLVMQSLAVFDKPVPSAAIRSVLPALPIDEILDKLVNNFIATYDHGQFFLHPLDRQYAYSQIPDQGNDYSKPVFHEMAARYYQSLSCPPHGSRNSLDDVMPILNAIDHLIFASNADDAVELLFDNCLYDDLNLWGCFLLLQDLYRRLLQNCVAPKNKIALSIHLGKTERNLGNLIEAENIYENAKRYLNKNIDPLSEIALFNALGDIEYFLKKYDLSLDYLYRAQELLATNPVPILLSENTGDIGNVMYSKGEFDKAQKLYNQAIAFSRVANNRSYEGIYTGDLGNVYCALYNKSGDLKHRENAISLYKQAIKIAEEIKDLRHESQWNGNLGEFYREVGESTMAELHLSKALSISEKIHFGHKIDQQVNQLTSVFTERVQSYLIIGDSVTASKVCQAFRQSAIEIGSAKLKAKADLFLIIFFFEQGRITEAIDESQKILKSMPSNIGILSNLGSICMQYGRLNSNEKILTLSADTYAKAIPLSPDDSVHDLYEGRANAYAILGKIEEAIDDYREVIKRHPQSIGAALSLAEVQIWAGRYNETEHVLETLNPQLRTPEENIIFSWLMCHALNLEGKDFSTFKKVIEDIAKENINYNVRDIEPYLHRLDSTKFSEKQIQNAWMIQTLIVKLAGLAS